MKYPVKSQTPKNACMECGESCRRPSRFCSEEHKVRWLANSRGIVVNPAGVAQVERERRLAGSTVEAREWRRKLSIGRPF